MDAGQCNRLAAHAGFLKGLPNCALGRGFAYLSADRQA